MVRRIDLVLCCALVTGCAEPPVEPTPAATPIAETVAMPAAAAPAPARSVPRCHVFGRVLDVGGAPLCDVKLEFGPVSDEWARGVSAAEFSVGDQDGIECVTDATGRFECVAPVPTAGWVSLIVKPDRFHLCAMRDFGKRGDSVTPRLQEGDNDLGDFVLDPAGAIAGIVVDAHDAPIANAEVSIDDAYPGGLSVNTLSDADGHFMIEHAPPGSWTLEAHCDGFVLTKTGAIDVVVGRVAQGPQITLPSAATIAGHVVDETGAPVPNANVTAFAELQSSRMAYATTGADGSFQLALHHVAPHRLEVTAIGFEKLDDFDSEKYAPGSTVRVVLKRMATATFVVVDAATSAPIEDYRLLFGDSQLDDRPDFDWKPFHFPNGIAQWPAEPGKSWFRVHAAGYAPLAGEVRFNAEQPRTQILRMLRPMGVTGIVRTRAGVSPKSCVLHTTVASRSVRVATERDGSFRFTELVPGKYALSGNAREEGYVADVEFRVRAGETTDLGILTLAEGPTVRGHALTTDRSPAAQRALTLRCWDDFEDRELRTADDGAFEFLNVAPGDYELRFESTTKLRAAAIVNGNWTVGSGDVDVDGSLHFVVTAGKDEDLTLVEPQEPKHTHLRLRALVNGAVDPHVGVTLHLPLPGQGVAENALPAPDAEGRIECDVDLVKDAWFELRSGNGLVLKRAKNFDASAGTVELEMDAVAGNLVVDMPDGVTIREGASVWVHLEYASAPPDLESSAGFRFGGDTSEGGTVESRAIQFTDRHYELGFVPPGRIVLTLADAIGSWKKRIVVEPRATTTETFTIDDMQLVGGRNW